MVSPASGENITATNRLDPVARRIAAAGDAQAPNVLQWLDSQHQRNGMRRRAILCAAAGWTLMCVAAVISSAVAIIMSHDIGKILDEIGINGGLSSPRVLPWLLVAAAVFLVVGGLIAWTAGRFPGCSQTVSAIDWSSASDAVTRLLAIGCPYPEAFRTAATVARGRGSRRWLLDAADRVENGGPDVVPSRASSGDVAVLELLIEAARSEPQHQWGVAADHFFDVARRRLVFAPAVDADDRDDHFRLDDLDRNRIDARLDVAIGDRDDTGVWLLMNRPARIALGVIGTLIGISVFLIFVPSLIGLLMIVLLIFATFDYSARRYRTTVKTFNSAVRAVSEYDGAIGKVALAFSRSGPLSGPCYEYARRLMMGENAIDAAVMSRVPLQLQTAIALYAPTTPDQPSGETAERRAIDREYGEAHEMAMVDSTMMPPYGQFIYLSATALVTCVVLGFLGTFILPTMEQMFEEFFSDELPYRWLFSAAPAVWILLLLVFVIVFLIPLLNYGHLLGIRFPHWIPLMPRFAERKSEVLNGIADGIDVGWPIGRSLAVGHSIATRRYERESFERSMRLIEQGVPPIESIRHVGWIDAREASWLADASPARTAELLRTIADQSVRDARFNVRWLMAIFFPVFVLLLGCSVMAYAFGFFATLTRLIHGLA